MQGRKVAVLLPLLEDGGGELDTLGKFAAMHDAVADSIYLVKGADSAQILVSEQAKDELESYFVIGDVVVDLLLKGYLELEMSSGQANTDYIAG